MRIKQPGDGTLEVEYQFYLCLLGKLPALVHFTFFTGNGKSNNVVE